MASGIPARVLESRTDVLYRRKHLSLEVVTEWLDNGSKRRTCWLVDSRNGERRRTTRKAGESEVFKIGQLELF